MVISPALRVECVCVCVLACVHARVLGGGALGWITFFYKEALHLTTTNGRATCLEPKRKQIATEDIPLWGTSIGLAGG